MEWFGLEGTLKLTQHHPCHVQGHLPLPQAPSPVQPGPGHRQGSRGSHSRSGHLRQGLPTLSQKNFFLISNVNLPSFSPITAHPGDPRVPPLTPPMPPLNHVPKCHIHISRSPQEWGLILIYSIYWTFVKACDCSTKESPPTQRHLPRADTDVLLPLPPSSGTSNPLPSTQGNGWKQNLHICTVQ